MKWYELTEKERVKKVYSKYTIEDFWKWWSSGEQKVMEVRIKGWQLIKETANLFNIPYSASGVFIWDYVTLKNVIKYLLNKTTIWFGINPKRKAYNKYGNKGYGGLDVNTLEIGFLFIDIDRKLTKGIATSKDLGDADKLANKILERLETENWSKSFIKICSGHGVQLVIKLDFPIKLPNIIFDENTKNYEINNEYEKIKLLIKTGIGKDIIKFSKKINNDLNAHVDDSCFGMGKVGALPFSKNFKYNTQRWRAIVELKDEINDGFSDYVLSKEEDIKSYKSKNIFIKSSGLVPKNRLREGKLKNNKLIRLLLDNDFPEGYINNTLWLQLKCLLRDSRIDIKSKEFIIIHEQIKKKHGRTFTLNFPDKKYKFNENVVNNYCIRCGLMPVYELWPNREKRKQSVFPIEWNNIFLYDEIMELNSNTDILDDMKICNENLTNDKFLNIKIIALFMKGCLKKYGEEKTKFYYDNLFEKYFLYT